jgi:hypothetical protein
VNKLKQQENFELATPKNINFNDSLSYTLYETDTAMYFNYKGKNSYYYGDSVNIWLHIITQEPNLISEKRIYQTTDYKIEIVQLSSQLIPQEDLYLLKKYFNVSIPFWPHESIWHGVRRDLIYLFE